MKVAIKSVDDVQQFIRERMLVNMNRSVASMRSCGCSEASIQAMVDDTQNKIAEACVDAAETFAALTESFNEPKVFN